MGTMPGGMVKLLFFAAGGPASKRRHVLVPWVWGEVAPDRPGRHRGGAGRGEASESDARRSGDTNLAQPTPRTSPVIAKENAPELSFAGPWGGRKQGKRRNLKQGSHMRWKSQVIVRLVLKKDPCIFNIYP